jgi:hypothetical protein
MSIMWNRLGAVSGCSRSSVFEGYIHDPCCGFGTIPEAAIRAGFDVTASDITHRGYWLGTVHDFFNDKRTCRFSNIVCNPPFNIAERFAHHALTLAERKVAIIFPTARLNAARWLCATPLRRIWLLTPRPSMPPGHVIAAGEKPGGGKMDFSWLVFEQGFVGEPELRRLRRDRVA